jgi:hypothetical protein
MTHPCWFSPTGRAIRRLPPRARLVAAGRWRQGDPDILIVFDVGYDVTRLAWQLKNLPVEGAGTAALGPGAVLPGTAIHFPFRTPAARPEEPTLSAKRFTAWHLGSGPRIRPP